MITSWSKAVIYGTHLDVVQRMLDFNYLCGKDQSIIWIISSDKRSHKLFYGDKEILIPTYQNIADIPTFCDTLLNFASYRSASQVIRESMDVECLKNIVVIAEWIPERETREIIALNNDKKLFLLWPSTVWGIIAWWFRIGNTWWSLKNIIKSRLYVQGSIWFVAKSWWMSNEMYRIIAKNTNWLHTGYSIGWDRFPLSTLKDIVLQYEKNKEIKLIILLGEVGNKDEIEIADLINTKQITKPLIAWVSGTSAEFLPKELQFWHAGAKANNQEETAIFKNNYLKKSWAYVPNSFSEFGDLIASVAKEKWLWYVDQEIPDSIMKKYDILQNRRASVFTSSISDERNELTYNWIPITDFCVSWSIARVIGHLRFKKELPAYWIDFIQTAIILLADHGPAVSWATNVIITARAGKDIVSSLIAWLTTIWPKFWWAIQDAASFFFDAVTQNMTPENFVDSMKRKGLVIPWIGHKIKSKYNPDKRCAILYQISQKIPSSVYLTFALEVEKLTLQKKANLILNVDWYVAAMLLDLMGSMWLSHQEIAQYIDSWICNGLFVLARSIGFIWHAIDQHRLGEWLYRTPADHILYLS